MTENMIVKELQIHKRGEILQDLIRTKLLVDIWIEKIALTKMIYSETEEVLSSGLIKEFSEKIGNLKVSQI